MVANMMKAQRDGGERKIEDFRWKGMCQIDVETAEEMEMETDAVGGQLIMSGWVSLLHMTDWDRDRENNQPALDLMDVVENTKTGGWAVDSLTCLQVSGLWKLFLKACEFGENFRQMFPCGEDCLL